MSFSFFRFVVFLLFQIREQKLVLKKRKISDKWLKSGHC
ncbi:MAG: hypothetical protein MRERV_15c031 [Mycoplasmataceae bacterium RV_VA103A]|nr:MAG: hypothetical protein MRERV_15c031 [Mycoplasmataceae bacterium RV_VA103A]